MHFDIELKISQQFMLDHFQVQLAHPADDRLTGLFVFDSAESWVLPLEHFQDVTQLFAFGRVLGLDCHADDRIGEQDRFEQDRVIRFAKRITGDAKPWTDHANDITSASGRNLFAPISLNMPQLSGVFFFVFARIVHATVGLELARINPHKAHVAMLVGQDLEDQSTKRFVRVRLAC